MYCSENDFDKRYFCVALERDDWNEVTIGLRQFVPYVFVSGEYDCAFSVEVLAKLLGTNCHRFE